MKSWPIILAKNEKVRQVSTEQKQVSTCTSMGRDKENECGHLDAPRVALKGVKKIGEGDGWQELGELKGEEEGSNYVNFKFSMTRGDTSFFEMINARFLEEIEFGKEENIRNVVYDEEYVNDVD
ncbi:hypothetical protein CR513_47972, partial [Mucuna pruriens]